MRETSIEAYRAILADGTLSKRLVQTYIALFHHGPMSQRETFEAFRTDHPKTKIQARTMTARFNELEDVGIVRCLKTRRPCRYSGKKVTIWDVTQDLPHPKDRLKILWRQRRKMILNLRKNQERIEALTGRPLSASIDHGAGLKQGSLDL